MRRLTAFPSRAACLLALGLLASCSDGTSFSNVETPLQPARTFSDEERLAARKLSIGSNETYDTASTPYARALLCRGAIEAIAERYRETGGQGGMQVRAIEQAAVIFDQRLQIASRQEAKSESDIRRDLERTLEEGPEIGAQAQLAVTCLQGLQ